MAAEAALCSALEKRGTSFHQHTPEEPASPSQPPALVGFLLLLFLNSWVSHDGHSPASVGGGQRSEATHPVLKEGGAMSFK